LCTERANKDDIEQNIQAGEKTAQYFSDWDISLYLIAAAPGLRNIGSPGPSRQTVPATTIKVIASLLNPAIFPRDKWIHFQISKLWCEWSATKTHHQIPPIDVHVKVAGSFYTNHPADTQRILQGQAGHFQQLPLTVRDKQTDDNDKHRDELTTQDTADCTGAQQNSKRTAHFALARQEEVPRGPDAKRTKPNPLSSIDQQDLIWSQNSCSPGDRDFLEPEPVHTGQKPEYVSEVAPVDLKSPEAIEFYRDFIPEIDFSPDPEAIIRAFLDAESDYNKQNRAELEKKEADATIFKEILGISSTSEDDLGVSDDKLSVIELTSESEPDTLTWSEDLDGAASE